MSFNKVFDKGEINDYLKGRCDWAGRTFYIQPVHRSFIPRPIGDLRLRPRCISVPLTNQRKPTMKKQSPAITKLKKENETLIQQLHEKDASAQYWKRRYEELEGRRVQREGEGFKLDGINSNRGSVMEASAHRALSELHSVAPNEVNVASLHRVIGSAQGALALALENTGRVQVDTIDLSPKKDQASDKLDKIASVLHRNERYG